MLRIHNTALCFTKIIIVFEENCVDYKNVLLHLHNLPVVWGDNFVNTNTAWGENIPKITIPHWMIDDLPPNTFRYLSFDYALIKLKN